MLERLNKLDVRWLYLLLALAIVIPLFKPLGLPIVVDEATRQVYDCVESIPLDSWAFLSFDFQPSTMTENGNQAAAVIRHCFQRNIKVLVGSAESNNNGVQLAQEIVSEVAADMGKEYGTDWVNLGFKIGEGMYVRAMIEDIIQANNNQDFTGQSLSAMSIMKGLTSLRQCTMVGSFTSMGSALTDFVQYLQAVHGTKVIAGVVSTMITQYIIYVQAGQYQGMLGGLSGAAQYEYLLSKPGKAIQGMDAQSVAHLLFFTLIVLGNIGYYVSRRKQSAGEAI